MDTQKFNQFTEKVLEKFTASITDAVFLMIEKDRELLHEYLLLLENNNLAYLNSSIAKAVKAKYNLENMDLKNRVPESKLIQSHELFMVDSKG